MIPIRSLAPHRVPRRHNGTTQPVCAAGLRRQLHCYDLEACDRRAVGVRTPPLRVTARGSEWPPQAERDSKRTVRVLFVAVSHHLTSRL